MMVWAGCTAVMAQDVYRGDSSATPQNDATSGRFFADAQNDALLMPQNDEGQDTLKSERLQEAVVTGVRADVSAPFAVSEVSSAQLVKFSKSGQELPFLFSRTPGVLAWSENGIGMGTSYMRIRGAGDSRINVTLDGVPLNSPEDQCVFWANMNSYSSLLGSVQIQRGVGTSTNGDGAFGGTVSLGSKSVNPNPFVEVTGAFGTYLTRRYGLSFSSGLLGKHFVVDGAFHTSATEGYIHGTAGRAGSWYAGLAWIGDKVQVRYRIIGNFEKTGQAWNGIEIEGLNTYREIWDAGLGLYNSLVESYDINQDGRVVFVPYTYDGGKKWERTTENFQQYHNLLTAAWQIANNWSTALTLHYTYGDGYYDELKPDCKLSKFGIPNFTASDGSIIKRTDFIRQKGLTQNTGGVVWNMNYSNDIVDINGGLSAQFFGGNHFGYLTFIGHKELSDKLKNGKEKYQYYDSDARKNDFSAYVKGTFHVTDYLNVFADLQYRGVRYKTDGYNDKFLPDLSKHYLNVNEAYNFFNPKGGISFFNGAHKAYASVARSHREPERNNFTDNGNNPYPKAEALTDFELGYSYGGKIFRGGVNLYYMDYDNQFVQTGQLSDIGENLTVNIKDSYRLGAEVSAAVDVLPWLTIEANGAFSRSRLRDFDEYVTTYDDDWMELAPTIVHHSDAPLAFSPNVIVNGFVDFHTGPFSATWHTSYVSKMYLDNTGCDARSLTGYSISNINASYTFSIGKALKSITIGADFGNIFNNHYAASGYAWSCIVGKSYPENARYQGVGFIPQGGISAIANVSLRF